MLFAVKNRLLPTVLLLAVLVAGANWARGVLGLVWRLELRPGLLGELLLGAGALALSDGLMHTLLRLTLGERYRSRYRALVQYFRPQGGAEIIAAGLLAGGEELAFRGVLLGSLLSLAGLAPAAAVALTALAFGLLHTLPSQQLLPFGVWAVWEGALLSGLYVWSGSLAVCIAVHVLHDLVGFSLFAYQRRTGWLL